MGKYSPEYLTGMKREPMTMKFVHRAISNGAILEALVTSCDDDLTLKLELGKGIYGYVPFEDIEYRHDNSEIKDITALSKVGRHIKFKMISFSKEDGQIKVHCSRKEAQKDCYENYISKLSPGDITDARIVRIENYGVFCDIGCGFVALLPTNNISVTHVVNPKEMLENISRLKVVVKEINTDGKIQLTHKELLGTWAEEASKFSRGDTVCGAVLSVEEYGVFIRLSQNLSGLAAPTQDIKINTGDLVSVRINSISDKSMKIKLTIIDKIDNCSESVRFKYYKTEGNIKEWVYSDTGKKRISTTFRGEK